MKNYITIKIMKKHLVMLSIVLIFICGMVSYYFWCSYSPNITIQISESGIGKENLKIAAPHIVIAANGIAEPAPSVELKTNNILMQHEFVCQNLKDNYKISDIKLDMEVKDNQTILEYYGTVADTSDKVSDYKNEIVLDFVLDVDITYKR